MRTRALIPTMIVVSLIVGAAFVGSSSIATAAPTIYKVALISDQPQADLQSVEEHRKETDIRDNSFRFPVTVPLPEETMGRKIRADFIAVKWNLLLTDPDILNVVNSALSEGRVGVLWGDEIPAELVDSMFGTSIEPTDQGQVMPANYQRAYQFIMLTSDKEGVIPLAVGNIEAPSVQWFMVLREIIQQTLKEEQSSSTDVSVMGDPSDYPIIWQQTDRLFTYYDSFSRLMGRLNVNSYLHMRQDGANGDYLFLQQVNQLDSGSYLANTPWYSDTYEAQHNLIYSTDDIHDWGPESSSNKSTWTVTLTVPFSVGVSWSFSTGAVDLTTTANTVDPDYVHFYWSNKPSVLPDHFIVKPGTQWYSAGTAAVMNTDHTIKFHEVNGSTVTKTPSVPIRYDY